MNWQTNDSLPFDAARQIIVTAWNEELKSYDYNIVSYYEPMGLWYGGPGILVRKEEIQYWSDIPAPDAPN
jgi:hypothetical protein